MRRFFLFPMLMNMVFAQGLLPGVFKMSAVAEFDSSAYKGLKSNMISDIVPQADTLLWLGTGAGLAVVRDTTSIFTICLLYTSPSPRDLSTSRMPSSA